MELNTKAILDVIPGAKDHLRVTANGKIIAIRTGPSNMPPHNENSAQMPTVPMKKQSENTLSLQPRDIHTNYYPQVNQNMMQQNHQPYNLHMAHKPTNYYRNPYAQAPYVNQPGPYSAHYNYPLRAPLLPTPNNEISQQQPNMQPQPVYPLQSMQPPHPIQPPQLPTLNYTASVPHTPIQNSNNNSSPTIQTPYSTPSAVLGSVRQTLYPDITYL